MIHGNLYARSLIEASLDPLVTINIEGKITDMNNAMVNITGMLREKLTGTDFFAYFTEPQKAREVYEKVFANGSVTDSPLTLRHINGKLTDVLFNGSVYKDDIGNVIGVVVVARDIAEQKWATDLRAANKELAFQNDEKEKRAAELVIANKELAFQNDEKEKRASELVVANKELAFQNDEKEKRASELVVANKELAFQNNEKEKRAAELIIANKELSFQNDEKGKRGEELVIANKELEFQNEEKEKRASELVVANKELEFQNEEKGKRGEELIIANKELLFQNKEKGKRAAELVIANRELFHQNKLKEKQKIVNKALEETSSSAVLSSQYSLSLIEASLDPLFVLNAEGKIIDINKATLNATETTRGTIIDTDFTNYFTEPGKARKAYRQIFAKGSIKDFPLTIKDGHDTTVLCNGSGYKDEKGNVAGVAIVVRDVTEQRRISAELREAKVGAEMATGLAEEAKSKAESLTHIAEAAVKAKQQFLSNMSHEIRTPMNAIIGFTKVLLKTELTTKQKEYLTAIKMSGDSLIVLINDILDLAKVDAGKMIFEQIPFRLELSVSAMIHLFETKILEKNLKLVKEYDTNIPKVLVGDPVRLHQIIMNLVSNAVKFTSYGTITVSANILTQNDDTVTIEFSVKDTGIGIAEEKIGKVFENFQQASSGTSRLYGGTGLGLAIVKQLVEPQGGTISVKSKLNEGSVFSFVLTFNKTDAEEVPESELFDLKEETRNIKVLVVEDIALNQLLMKTVLDDFGFERDIAANGRIAIEKLQAKSYDVILMDLQMPEMNGFEATDYIRNKLNSKIPIIALTADVTTIDLAKCRAVGMNDYVAKPIDEKLLYNKIVGLVKKQISPFINIDVVDTLIKNARCIDMEYLTRRTKSDPAMMMEMISLYLVQTPPLIRAMKQSFHEEDWKSLYSAVHKMIPSFSIMGISTDFENMARKVQEYASTQQQAEGISTLVLQLENICYQACRELEVEYNTIKNAR